MEYFASCNKICKFCIYIQKYKEIFHYLFANALCSFIVYPAYVWFSDKCTRKINKILQSVHINTVNINIQSAY